MMYQMRVVAFECYEKVRYKQKSPSVSFWMLLVDGVGVALWDVLVVPQCT